jgi:hypothetical protein
MGLIEQASRERRRPQFFPLSGAPRPTNRHMKIVGTFSGVSAREVREWDTKRSATDPWGQGAVGASSRNFGSTVESPSPNLPRPTRRTAKAAPPQSAEARRNLEGGRSGRTIDVHALRTTFGTLLSKGESHRARLKPGCVIATSTGRLTGTQIRDCSTSKGLSTCFQPCRSTLDRVPVANRFALPEPTHIGGVRQDKGNPPHQDQRGAAVNHLCATSQLDLQQ